MAAGPSTTDRLYLLVFGGEQARLVEVHPRASLTIGSDPGRCAVVLDDPSVAAEHARISLENGTAFVEDLGAADPTLLDGEPFRGKRALRPGDLLAIGQATLEVRSAARTARRRLVSREELTARADDELERALRYGRPLTLAILQTGGDVARRGRAAETLAARLRSLDVLAQGPGDELWVLLPETPADRAPLACRRFIEVLTAVAPEARAGFGSTPEDGGELDALAAAARRALEGPFVPDDRAGTAVQRLTFGDRTVLVADPAMTRLYELLARLARTDLSVLIEGETGAGKEIAALALHHGSARRAGPFVRINCAALPQTLVESELFGHEKGAFSGAEASKPGLVEIASGGTLLLDEVGDLPREAQAKLLRVIEERRVLRVGSVEERPIDVRVVAATNHRLRSEVDAGLFRADLFFRLAGGVVRIPPLRDRRREIAPLVEAFLEEACRRLHRPLVRLSPEARARLELHEWPGNVRELRNVAELLAATASERVVDAAAVEQALGSVDASPALALALAPAAPPDAAAPRFRPIEDELREIERDRMRAALAAAGGNQTRAAALIAMPIRTWYTKAKQHGLR